MVDCFPTQPSPLGHANLAHYSNWVVSWVAQSIRQSSQSHPIYYQRRKIKQDNMKTRNSYTHSA